MSAENCKQNIYENNPLHGLKLEVLIEQLVNHYGFEILAEYTNIKCFKNNPSIASSIKFLRNTDWAREKLEIFYLYKFKNLPKPDDANYALPPRDRIIPAHQKPRSPVELKLGEAPPPKQGRAPANKDLQSKRQPKRQSKNRATHNQDDPWAAYR
ncbi:VF530 family DNA-binding protein [Catenovulum sediminis]|uniref:VF530 family protein n=1 Tax=Catenovulum sediminis TaxID=1740262 RepID=A0ABV1RMQ6_9ALTE|nr:VF530 family protein [Catenovulum sediminis]